MTIAEAAAEWNVSEMTVLEYIHKGYIYGLFVENNTIKFPNVPKPYIKRKPKNVKSQDKYILTAMNKEMYVNANIMDISVEKFKDRMIALERSNRIFIKESAAPDYTSNLDFGLVPAAGGTINVSIDPTVDYSPTMEIKVADQIGVVNGKIG